MINLRQYRPSTNRLPDYLPWAALVAPGVILQKDAFLQKTFGFRGPDLASSSQSELVSAVARLNNALKRLGSGWSLFIEAQRFHLSEYQGASWSKKDPGCLIVNGEDSLRKRGAILKAPISSPLSGPCRG